jgi:G3E family GTPase
MTHTPINLITGFLGVGKTTAITHLLRTKPPQEYWAVLVNEFGQIGIDGALLAEQGGRVVEVPGGCICCTTSPMLRTSLTQLLRERRPDRLLLEPSGLGNPGAIRDLLRDPYLSQVLDIHNTLTLIDPRHIDDARYNQHAVWVEQVQAADILVANQIDLANAAEIDRYWQFARHTFPSKTGIFSTLRGQLDPAWLDLPYPETSTRYRPTYLANTHQHNRAIHSTGWVFSTEVHFDADRIAEIFMVFNTPELLGLAGLLRAKAVFNTTQGWYSFNWVSQHVYAETSAYRRDSRIEVIVETKEEPDWSRLRHQLEKAMTIRTG